VFTNVVHLFGFAGIRVRGTDFAPVIGQRSFMISPGRQ
jgi:hypothetical protein